MANEEYFAGSHGAKLYKYAHKLAQSMKPYPSIDYEDLVQEAILYVWVRRDEWKDDGRATFHTWAYSRMFNAMRQAQTKVIGRPSAPGGRWSGREPAELVESLEPLYEPDWLAFDAAERVERLATPKQIEALELSLMGYNSTEIGDILGIHKASISGRLHALANRLHLS